jgi:hypothetical protein
VLEDGRSVTVDRLAEEDPRMPSIHQFGKLFTSGLKRMLAKVAFRKGQQVESKEHSAASPCPTAQRMEGAMAVWPQDDSFAIDESGTDWQSADGGCDVYEVFGEIRYLARPKPHLPSTFQGKKPVPVVLKFVQPFRATRRLGH